MSQWILLVRWLLKTNCRQKAADHRGRTVLNPFLFSRVAIVLYRHPTREHWDNLSSAAKSVCVSWTGVSVSIRQLLETMTSLSGDTVLGIEEDSLSYRKSPFQSPVYSEVAVLCNFHPRVTLSNRSSHGKVPGCEESREDSLSPELGGMYADRACRCSLAPVQSSAQRQRCEMSRAASWVTPSTNTGV